MDTTEKLIRLRESRAEAVQAIESIDSEIREAVTEAFAQKLSAPEIAAALGLSIPRVYQIRKGVR